MRNPDATAARESSLLDDSYLTVNDYYALQKSASLLRQQRPSGLSRTSNSIQFNQESASIHELDRLHNEWSNWPEFGQFQAALGATNAELLSAPKQLTVSGRLQQAELMHQHLAPELLSLPMDESVISALNVLTLTRVGSVLEHNYNHNSQPTSPATTTNTKLPSSSLSFLDNNNATNHTQTNNNDLNRDRRRGFMATIECEASNLHYDLRSLIHLFAPSSLFGSAPGPQAQIGETVARATSDQSRLGLAIQAALELSSRSGDSIPLVGHSSQQNNVGPSSVSIHAAAESARFLSPTASSQNSTHQTSSTETTKSTSNLNTADTSLVDIRFHSLHQQLSRTHELARRRSNIVSSQQQPPHETAASTVFQHQSSSDSMAVKESLDLEIYCK